MTRVFDSRSWIEFLTIALTPKVAFFSFIEMADILIHVDKVSCRGTSNLAVYSSSVPTTGLIQEEI